MTTLDKKTYFYIEHLKQQLQLQQLQLQQLQQNKQSIIEVYYKLKKKKYTIGTNREKNKIKKN